MSIIVRALGAALLLALGSYALVAASLVYLKFLPPLTTGVQIQRRVEALVAGEEYTVRHDFVPMERISRNLRRAVVAAEDARFYTHEGFDFEEMRRARETAARNGTPPRGASTITQQLVKNLYFTTHRSYVRKVLEAAITPAAELVLGKERILELYLNVVEWGPGIFGAEAAALHHYRVPAAELTREQAARLAAVLPDPRSRRPETMGRYANTIQTRMGQMGW